MVAVVDALRESCATIIGNEENRPNAYSWRLHCVPDCFFFLAGMFSSVPINVLDELQQQHQVLETCRDIIYHELNSQVPRTIPQSIAQEAKVSSALQRQMKRAQAIASIYKDESGVMKELIQKVDSQDVFSNFYNDIKKLRERHGDKPKIATSLEDVKEQLKAEIFEEKATLSQNNAAGKYLSTTAPVFSGEEHRGRYVDMITLHQEYVNLVHPLKSRDQSKDNANSDDTSVASPVSYIEYLENGLFASNLNKIKAIARNNRPYKRYCNNILEYLQDYISRTQPILSVEILHDALTKATTTVTNKPTGETAIPKKTPDLSSFESLKDLEAVDANVLKQMLGAKKMKQGGTVSERARRLWAVKGLAQDEIPKKYMAKTRKRKAKDNGSSQGSPTTVVNKEYMIQLLTKSILDRLHSTVSYLRRKQTRSYEETLEDLADEERLDTMAGGESEKQQVEIDEIVYNPKNVPLGLDGKPIPYWMFKLHGFDKHFTCEICGNATYIGPKAFEKHFSEGRHSMGMSTLGIPNSKEYYGLTKIEEVKALHKKLTEEKKEKLTWNRDEDEEFEDSEGNVLSRETYENLKRNGLL